MHNNAVNYFSILDAFVAQQRKNQQKSTSILSRPKGLQSELHSVLLGAHVKLSATYRLILWGKRQVIIEMWLDLSCLSATFFFVWSSSPQWARASSFLRFLDHTQRRTTVDRTPLDE